MLARQFFYDHFTPEDICGMFTPGHFLSILLFFWYPGAGTMAVQADGQQGGTEGTYWRCHRSDGDGDYQNLPAVL